MDGRHARRPVRGVEIVAAHDDDRHAVAPGVVDRHAAVLQADGAVAQRHQRLAGDLEVAVRDADRGFLVRAGEELRHLVAAVVDQRLVDAAVARRAVGRQILDVERLDDIDHEVGAGDAADSIRLGLWVAGLGSDCAARSAAAPTAGARRRRPAAVVAFAACGASVPAAPATATPVRNLRRSTFAPESCVPCPLRAMKRSLERICLAATRCSPRADQTDCIAGQFVAPESIAAIAAASDRSQPSVEAALGNFSRRQASIRQGGEAFDRQ